MTTCGVGQYPQINDDLVNSHHLLLCCLDMLSCAAYTKRQDLLHPQCSIFQDSLVDEDQDTLSVLTQLCKSYNGKLVEYMCVMAIE